jgi:hypothetical protein
LRDKDFFCSLDVLYRGLGKGTYIAIFDEKFFFSAVNFFPIFGHQNHGSGSGSGSGSGFGFVSGSALTKNADSATLLVSYTDLV